MEEEPLFALDVDDVLMRPPCAKLFYVAVGLAKETQSKLGVLQSEYKKGVLKHRELYRQRHELLELIPEEKRKKAIQDVADRIPQESLAFVEALKKKGRVWLVSNSDADLIAEVAQRLDVRYLAPNKFVLELVHVTNHKDAVLDGAGLKPTASVTDDPINDRGLLTRAKLGIIIKRDEPAVDYPTELTDGFTQVDDLRQALTVIGKFLGETGGESAG